LKTKTFISQKSLDTPVFRLIRFLQKVLTALPPLELFSLEEEATQLPGGLFVFAFRRCEPGVHSAWLCCDSHRFLTHGTVLRLLRIIC
jgi:hypothetical protein